MCETGAICKSETTLIDRAAIEKKLRSLTTEELFDHALKICLENQELRAKSSYQEREMERIASDREKAVERYTIFGESMKYFL
jgi:hypothetical protein